MKIDRANLPRDLDQCHAIIGDLLDQMDAKERKFQRVLHALAKLLRWRYGPKRERVDENQLVLFAVALVEAKQDIAPEPPREPKAKRKGHGRRPLPKHLERRPVVYDVPPEGRQCPVCHEELHRLGDDKSERLEYVPASLYVIEETVRKYACRKGCTVVSGQKPMQPIEKGLPGPGLLAHVAVAKYGDHVPLHRQEAILAREGVTLSRRTLCDWMADCGQLARPLYELMKQEALLSKVLQTDDTPVAVLDPALPRTRVGRIWTYVGDAEHPYTVYDYTPDRSRDGPDAFLKEFCGFLQADAYKGYDALYRDPQHDVTEVGCWAHCRRYFYDAQNADVIRSIVMLAYIRLLYAIEREARDQKLDHTGRLALRQAKARPILEDIKAYLDREVLEVLPKSAIGEAIAYARSNWGALIRYAENGALEIDNNGAERSLRGVAVGRKNWMFFGSDRGGQTAAVLTSLITTTKRLGINPFAYLRDVFERISAHPASQLAELLPDRWKATHGTPA